MEKCAGFQKRNSGVISASLGIIRSNTAMYRYSYEYLFSYPIRYYSCITHHYNHVLHPKKSLNKHDAVTH